MPKELSISDYGIKTSKQVNTIQISDMFEKKNQALETVMLTIVKPNFEAEKI
jgi:hypothetical protein